MNKKIVSLMVAAALITPIFTNNADAATKANSQIHENILNNKSKTIQTIKLPGLSKTPLSHMKKGTFTIGGNPAAKLGVSSKDMVQYYGDSDVDVVTRFAGGSLMESSYELVNGSIELYYSSKSRHSAENDLKLVGMAMFYDNSKVTDANIVKYMGKPSEIIPVGSNLKIYSYAVKDKIFEFEMFKKVTKKNGKKITKWYVQRVTYGNSNF